MAFTVPEALCNAVVGAKVGQLLKRVKTAAAAAGAGESIAGCEGGLAFEAGDWRDICLKVEGVGPQSVSL